jgi:hypothetical protein
MSRPKDPSKKSCVLVVFWEKSGFRAWSVYGKNKTVRTLDSLDGVASKAYKKTVLLLGRNVYLFKAVDFTNSNKNVVDKAVRLNIQQWSPFRNSRFVHLSRPRGDGFRSLLFIVRGEDYDEALQALGAKGIVPNIIVPESLCYLRYFGDGPAAGAVKKSDGIELLSVEDGIEESQFIPLALWTEDAFGDFLKRLGPKGLDLKKFRFISRLKDDFFARSASNQAENVQGRSDIDVIMEGADFFSAAFLKSVEKKRTSLLTKEDWKSLKPGLMIILGGILLFQAAQLYRSQRHLHLANIELAQLQRQTSGVEQKIDEIAAVQKKVDSVLETLRSVPSPLLVWAEFQRVFPEKTNLQSYKVQGRKVEITGYAPQSSEIVSRLGRSLFFENIVFKSPIERIEAANLERFTVEMDLKKR